jgi:hypothetical protein
MGLLILFVSAVTLGDEITSVQRGDWNSPSTWSTGTVPTGADNVTISLPDTVTIDTTVVDTSRFIACNNLTVRGMLRLSSSIGMNLTVNGNIAVESGGTFRVLSNTIGGNLVHTITLYGNVTNNGTFDLKNGSANATLSICNTVFTGPNNSIVTMNGGYLTTNNEFGGVRIEKSGTARIILASNMYMPSGSSAVTTPGGNPILTFVHGLVETDTFALIHLWTSSSGVTGASDSSYILGNMGRGLTTTGTTTDRIFNVGDATGYRPVRARAISTGNATGHYMRAEIVNEPANTGSSALNGSIDKVWDVRYYKLSYHSGGVGASQMTFDRFSVSYRRNEGVAAGNTNLRVAYSTDGRATWNGQGPTINVHTTSLDTVPRYIVCDSLTGGLVITDGSAMYVTLARLSGTSENSLVLEPEGVRQVSDVPAAYSLTANYPNPFNPSTTFDYTLPVGGNVMVRVFNVLGQLVATPVNEHQTPGYYRVEFDASDLPSGVYLYRIESGSFLQTRRMVLVK